MRFCFVIFKYIPFGGLQRSMGNIALACTAAGHDVVVATTSWEGPRLPGVDVKIFSVPPKPTRKRDLRFIRLFSMSGMVDDFDLVVGFNKMPGLDVYYSGDTCFAVKAHETHGWVYRLTPRCRTALALERAVFDRRKNTRILVVAPDQQTDYQKYYHTRYHRFYLIPPGISRDRIAPPDRQRYGKELRKTLGIDPSWYIVVMVASHLALKGYHRSLAAFLALPESVRKRTMLLLVGADPAIPAYRREIEKQHLEAHVRFLGGRSDVPRILFGSDVLIHPAHREATGNVLLEGAVAGLPVICSRVCGYSSYIVRHDLGRVIPEPFEQRSLNLALHEALTDGEKRRAWQDNARRFATCDEIYSRPRQVVRLLAGFAGATPEKDAHNFTGS